MNRHIIRTVVVALVVSSIAMSLDARDRKPRTTKGTHRDWGGRIDEITIVREFAFSEYDTIIVSGFSTDDVELPGKDDNTYEPVKTVLRNISGPFVEGFAPELPGKSVQRGKTSKRDSIVIRGKVFLMDPGSRAARYWGGFGAGAARTGISGEAVDEKGRVLFKFKQERRSGVGVGGGGYEALLNRNIRAIGADVAFILNQFK